MQIYSVEYFTHNMYTQKISKSIINNLRSLFLEMLKRKIA